MPLRQVVAVTMLLVALCACDKRNSSFDQECRSVQTQLSRGTEPTQSSGPKQGGDSTEASWQFNFQGDRDAAIKAFEARIPAGYKQVQRNDSELGYSRFDGSDSFYLTLKFNPATQGSTTVAVNLKSTPD